MQKVEIMFMPQKSRFKLWHPVRIEDHEGRTTVIAGDLDEAIEMRNRYLRSDRAVLRSVGKGNLTRVCSALRGEVREVSITPVSGVVEFLARGSTPLGVS